MRGGLLSAVGVILAVGAGGLAPARFAAARDRVHEAADLGSDCAPQRPAIAHHAGGVVVQNLKGKDRTPPIPCATPTGVRTGEVSIVVTNKGAVLFQPAVSPSGGRPVGVLRSVD